MRTVPIIPSGSIGGGIDWTSSGKDQDDGSGNSGLGNWSSLIGIVTAIVGNILIALALNVQRYSHIQLHKRRVEARERARQALKRSQSGRYSGYGTTEDASDTAQQDGDHDTMNDETHPLTRSFQSTDTAWTERSGDESKVASTYLKSPSWWSGQILMTVGEMGNFLAYGFAPASIVSPLGVVALISNCVIAPLFFGESFRKRDLCGVVIAVAGAITVVLSANQEETKLNPHDVWDHISSLAFKVYLGVTIFLIIILMWLSPKYGNRTILIDLGLVGLFGGYTALSTKGVSSMLSSTLLRAFTTPVTYGLIIVLLGTAVMQVRYVNKALQRFDSTQVIPIQFVLFTLSVIIGSAVLYRDFERTTARQAAKFVGGCLLTFFGVFLITSGRTAADDEDGLSDDENVEETIGLRDQERTGSMDRLQPLSAASSRRSSRTSRASLAESGVKPLTPVEPNRGIPPSRRHDASTSRISLPSPGEAPLLNNPWQNSVDDHIVHPGLPPTLSADSVPTVRSVTSTAVSEPAPAAGLQSTLSLPSSVVPPPSPDRLTTARPSMPLSRPHSHHYSSNFISPSPLSSTVSAVVADALLRGDPDSLSGRRKSIRRLRPSIRSSLFVSQDENVVSPTAEPLLRSQNDVRRVAEQDESQGSDHKARKSRARSLSNTLADIFGRKRSRRHSDPEAGENQASEEGGSRV